METTCSLFSIQFFRCRDGDADWWGGGVEKEAAGRVGLGVPPSSNKNTLLFNSEIITALHLSSLATVPSFILMMIRLRVPTVIALSKLKQELASLEQ